MHKKYEKVKEPRFGWPDQTGILSEKKRGKKMKKNEFIDWLYYTRGVLKNKGENIKKVLSR